jgi:hypothetical protein
MNTTELFLKTIDAYKTWVKTGMDHKNFAHLYDAWDDALMAFAKSMNVSRGDAANYVYVVIRKENVR